MTIDHRKKLKIRVFDTSALKYAVVILKITRYLKFSLLHTKSLKSESYIIYIYLWVVVIYDK